MPKKLVLCLDGTSNRYCRDNTNVVKFVSLLDKRVADQLVYYQPGIGTFTPPGIYGHVRKWILTRIDLAFATLLKYHVQDAYQFLMRYHESGDEIYIFGFSRGAYTARVLAGMLCKVGLLTRGNEELVPFAWKMYAGNRNDDEARGFRDTFAREVPVSFIGVWDTVKSVRYAWKDPSFEYTQDNRIVKKVRHALSLDERRSYFRQNMWRLLPRAGQDVLQIWFAGVHCDVGGGYLERQSGLSKEALAWMVGEVGGDLAFRDAAFRRVVPSTDTKDSAAPSALAQAHRSLRGLWWLVELLPKRYKDPRSNFKARWMIPLGRPRFVPDDPDARACIHASVQERMSAGIGYAPKNLPPDPLVIATRPPVTRPE